MNNIDYENLCLKENAIPLARPFWKAEEYHQDYWNDFDIQVLICQRKTKEVTQLCLESLLRFYPNVRVLVVDGASQDDSTLYLRYMALKHPNVKVWERIGKNSHGETMDEAILQYITTEYVLLMDSDVITMRYGMIEGMLAQFDANKKLYATGNLMLVSKSNQACGEPKDENDVLRYAHPCLSVYHVPTYKTLYRFIDHGAACCENMIEAQAKGLDVGAFPVDRYTIHQSGSSWQEIRAVWNNDNDVFIRPFVTFVTSNGEQVVSLQKQSDRDYDIVPIGKNVDTMVSLHGRPDPHVRVMNNLYDIRFRVTGEYVCVLPEQMQGFPEDFITTVKQTVIEQQAPESLFVNGIRFVQRKLWQSTESLSS